ncbi:pentapeptide repeat-containing protein [Baaleninema sp.]|uniref:pentapeptide repeat-containing protein n=1 Tax=Baaleninema sp. TaxID=3101197 RepID=UPI003CFF0472
MPFSSFTYRRSIGSKSPNFTGLNFTGLNFTGLNFTGLNFTGLNFRFLHLTENLGLKPRPSRATLPGNSCGKREGSNSTQGHWETASKEGTTGETSTSADKGKPESVSGVAEPVTALEQESSPF